MTIAARATVKSIEGVEMMQTTCVERPLLSTATAALAACALLVAGPVRLSLAASSSQPTFRSPDDAGRALVSAVQKHDEQAVTKILDGGSELVSTDDAAEDTLERDRFVEKYQQMHRWVGKSSGSATLYIGAENWPFPVPLKSRHGMWRFDVETGSDEILFRRIGENEVTAIGMCDTLVTAEAHPGTNSEADRLVKALLPHVQEKAEPLAFHGYYFRILPGSAGDFSAVAYPTRYRSSGVMTFIVSPEGRVSEKDLGPNTAKIAAAIATLPADATWAPVE
jgi:hypothetical protein